jgi:hypothetical protein
MFRLPLTAVTLGLLTACCLRAGDEPPAPAPETLHGADPEFAVARMDTDGMVVIHTLRRVPKAEVHMEKQTAENGAVFEKPVVVTQMVPEVKDDHFRVGDLQAYDAGGAKLDAQTLPERLKAGAVVLLSTDGDKVDAKFRAAVKEGTLVLVPPVQRTDANPAPKTPVEKQR